MSKDKSPKKSIVVTFNRDKKRGTTMLCCASIWSTADEHATHLADVTLDQFAQDSESKTIELPQGTYVATARVTVVREVNGRCGHEVLIDGKSMGSASTSDIGTASGTQFPYMLSNV
jgi:hypothetical protein